MGLGIILLKFPFIVLYFIGEEKKDAHTLCRVCIDKNASASAIENKTCKGKTLELKIISEDGVILGKYFFILFNENIIY